MKCRCIKCDLFIIYKIRHPELSFIQTLWRAQYSPSRLHSDRLHGDSTVRHTVCSLVSVNHTLGWKKSQNHLQTQEMQREHPASTHKEWGNVVKQNSLHICCIVLTKLKCLVALTQINKAIKHLRSERWTIITETQNVIVKKKKKKTNKLKQASHHTSPCVYFKPPFWAASLLQMHTSKPKLAKVTFTLKETTYAPKIQVNNVVSVALLNSIYKSSHSVGISSHF